MAVFTAVTLADLQPWIKQFPLGGITAVRGIASGIENSNFFIDTDRGEFVLTIFEKLSFTQLPFYLELMRHLAERGVAVPAPQANNQGELVTALHGKPASIVSKLSGHCDLAPGQKHCAEVGTMLAKMHVAAADFSIRQPNLRGLAWWQNTTPIILPYLPPELATMLLDELDFQEGFAESELYMALPNGPVHADLFRNNVMFDGENLSGFFDFYFAGCDTWLFDVAVTINDWCIDLDSGRLDHQRVRAMLDAYHHQRPFTAAEQASWQPMLRAAALRFWLSRLYDFYLPRDAEILTPHDPAHFQRILQQRISVPAPELF